MVSKTNTQVMSGSRLHYRPFGGAKQPAVRKEDYSHGGAREWKRARAGFCGFRGHRLGGSKALLEAGGDGTQATESGELKQTPEELSSWAAALHHRFGGCPVAVALEQSSGALVYQLSQYPHLWLYPVHPATAAHYRQAFYPSGSKSDPADTGLLLELVVHHRDRLRRFAPDTPETRLLRTLVQNRFLQSEIRGVPSYN